MAKTVTAAKGRLPSDPPEYSGYYWLTGTSYARIPFVAYYDAARGVFMATTGAELDEQDPSLCGVAWSGPLDAPWPDQPRSLPGLHPPQRAGQEKIRAADLLGEVGNGLRILVKAGNEFLPIAAPKQFLLKHSTFVGREAARDDGGIDVFLPPAR